MFLADELERADAHDADRRFVLLMCLYVGHVARGELPGPYSDDDARRFAWAYLIPAELLKRAQLDVELRGARTRRARPRARRRPRRARDAAPGCVMAERSAIEWTDAGGRVLDGRTWDEMPHARAREPVAAKRSARGQRRRQTGPGPLRDGRGHAGLGWTRAGIGYDSTARSAYKPRPTGRPAAGR